MCSCLVTPGEYNKGRIYTNIKDLRVLARCPKPRVAGYCGDDWNEKIYEAVIKRISRAHVPCKVDPSIRHHYINHNHPESGNELPKKAASGEAPVGSATMLQGPQA